LRRPQVQIRGRKPPTVDSRYGRLLSHISGKVLQKDEYNWGFDAQSSEFKDLVKAGIIDPTKVVRTALQHAASVGSLLITTEGMAAERPEKRPERWLGESEQSDKWFPCLKAALMPRSRREYVETITAEP
jgi:hypothetical protein